MLQNVLRIVDLFVFYTLITVTESSLRHFKPGKPLSSDEFLLAEKLQENEDDIPAIELDSMEGDIINSFTEKKFFSIEDYLWPKGQIPYLLDEEYDEKGRLLIARAFKEFQNKTCVRFIPRVLQKDYIRIAYEKGCSSSVGRLGGPQTLVLGRGCYALGIMIHELMHTLGFIHEQSRTDRDDYVTVMWENIKEGRTHNFQVWDWYSDRILSEKYDYSSILHYNKYAFSKDPKNKPTVVPKKKNVDIGQRKSLSHGDIRKINQAYRCSN